MASRIILGGRQLGTGRYGGDPKCMCGESVVTLGRCQDCHDALRRRRLGLPPNDEAERRRLAGYLEKFDAMRGRCADCNATGEEEHQPYCAHFTGVVQGGRR